jgi:hypothetical protein
MDELSSVDQDNNPDRFASRGQCPEEFAIDHDDHRYYHEVGDLRISDISALSIKISSVIRSLSFTRQEKSLSRRGG